MLNDELLEDFMRRFYGYGTFHAPIWFVGMEEGGGTNLEEISQRLAAWDTLGRNTLADVVAFHGLCEIERFWNKPVMLQPTWASLIRVLLGSKGLSPTTEDVKSFQRQTLGRSSSGTCLLELMPLPSPNTATWNYSSFSSLPNLQSRKNYLDYYSPLRIQRLRALAAEYQPSAIVFYGLGYLPHWERVAGTALRLSELDDVYIGHQGSSTFVAMKHPAARSVTNSYFQSIGQLIGNRESDHNPN